MLTEPARAAGPSDPGFDGLVDAELVLAGMHCSACATRIEKSLNRLPAVASASVNLATERAFVSYDPHEVTEERICQTVADLGYHAAPAGSDTGRSDADRSDRWGLRCALSWPLAITATVIALAAPESPRTGWTVLALAFAVEAIGGWPFVRNSVRLARHGAANMDTLVALGTLAALAVSAVVTIALDGRHIHVGGGGALAASLHGVMAPLIVSILATGRFIESAARGKAARAMRSLLSLRPPTARLVADPTDEQGVLVSPESVRVGSLVRVRPTESIPLDGTIVTGVSPIDESMLTGEPFPAERAPGSRVTGGTINGGGALVVRVDSLASESVLARLEKLVEDAQRDKAPLQRLADRISGVFVPAVLIGSAFTFLLWWMVGDSLGRAALSGLAVLLVACPCAMGLAAPVAMMVGCGRASAMGMFVRSGDALERLAKVDTVCFDKTGTLTERRAVVTTVIPGEGLTRAEILALAAAVEADSDHPIALAITAATQNRPAATGISSVPGVGVFGDVDQRRISVVRFTSEQVPTPIRSGASDRLARGETVVLVLRDEETIGAIAVSTPLRPEAGHAVRRLAAAGVDSTILSGDNNRAVETAAATLGVTAACGELSPEAKVQALESMRAAGKRPLMVGDGVNDAPALAASDVGCAIGSGSEVALAHSDVALLSNDLEGVPDAIGMARSTYAIILQNFGWAMGYNISALPLAAFGLLDPIVAAFAMGLSSVLVVLNSLRLMRLNRCRMESARTATARATGRGLAVSFALPIVLFAGLTVVGQTISPARGESLLPALPSLTIINFPHGGSVETYFEPGGRGLNQWHLIFYGSKAELKSASPMVTASYNGSPPQPLRRLKIATGHYTDFVVLQPGRWTFHVVSPFGTRTVSFNIEKTVG